MLALHPLHLLCTQMTSLLSSASAMASDMIQSQMFGWPEQPAVNKIDTHHHIVPDFYAKGSSLIRR